MHWLATQRAKQVRHYSPNVLLGMRLDEGSLSPKTDAESEGIGRQALFLHKK